MGLLDVLNGMQNGPRGGQQSGGSGSGMSPMTMALIGLLAYKAIKSFGGQTAAPGVPAPGGGASANPSAGGGLGGGLGGILGGLLGGKTPGASADGGGAGGLGDILSGRGGGNLGELLPGGLGGLLNSPAAGSVISGGLASVIKELQNSGHGNVAQSWVGAGQNEGLDPDSLAKALGSDAIDAMVKQTGMGRDELLQGLSQQLPQLVDHLTPDGRLPTPTEAARMV